MRGARSRGAAVAALALALSGVGSLADAAEKAPSASDVAEAQKRANAAAARLADAETRLARAEEDVAKLEARTSAARSRLTTLEGEVRELAVQQYVAGGEPVAWLSQDDIGDAVRGRAMLRFVTVGRTDAVDEYRVARSDLEAGQDALTDRLEQQRSAVAKLRRDRSAIVAELDRLAGAQREFEARQAAQRAAAERAAAEAARRRPGPGPRLTLPPVQVPSPLRVIGSGNWICPVQGPRAFTNDWGQPRSGGRRHQGNDILSPRGTPVVASVAGTVKGHSSSLGGISYYLTGSDGNTYFGTHLDRLSGASGRVAAGTVIGYVGNTGNARGGPPHLHFEIHPGGGGPVNPYPTLTKYC